LPQERHKQYLSAASGLGMAATRIEERVSCAPGMETRTEPSFESGQSIPMGGVMILLPFLPESGLLTYRTHYQQRSGYYSFDSLLITVSFLLLLRIKTIEQSKLHNPGELGKLIGYDRIPEVKKLRGLLKELTCQVKCEDWGKTLSGRWIGTEQPELYYVDGHVQVYHGHLAELGKKHVSRQRLCLPGMMEFRVNSGDGLPFFFITAEVNEKMIEMLEEEIIPYLIAYHSVSAEHREKMSNNPDYPLFTLVFDREGYSPALFQRIWEKHRIAVLTYRKNVKDEWEETVFGDVTVTTQIEDTVMKLHEEKVTFKNGYSMREVRRLSADGHQTGIITNNRILSIAMIAAYMFGRWIQENFFRYLRQEYSFDKIIQYATDEVDINIKVVNREYSNIEYRIKKLREKLSRLKANLYDHQQTAVPEKKKKNEDEKKNENHADNESRKRGKWFTRQLELQSKIQQTADEIEKRVAERKTVPYKIPVGEMPQESRYAKLNQESKYLMNIIKMICYRAETAFAHLLAPHYGRDEDEIRALVKAITLLTVDLIPDYDNKQLKIVLYPPGNIRSRKAIAEVIKTVNETKTDFPGNDLVMIFNITTN
jgi:Skp family chaperone for outer membrane proteins